MTHDDAGHRRRDAEVAIHAAARQGRMAEVKKLLDRDPELVRAPGVDGCSPLHVARTVDVAELLVARGADPDARDDDHRSTPAQWRIHDAPDVVRYLLDAGATADIFMAAGLGDLQLARRLTEEDPACTTYRIGNNRGPFPGIGFEGRGGTIYQWTLGFNRSPHEIAKARGHEELFDFLVARTPPKHLLLVSCMLPDRAGAEAIVAEHPELIGELDDEDRALLAKSCWETNRNIEAVRLMLDLGFPVDAPEHNHGYTALHNAAWCGDAALVELLLEHGHQPDLRDPRFNSTPIGFAIHSCVTARRHPGGDFPAVIERLLAAGTPLDEEQYPSGDDGIDHVLRAHLDATAPKDLDDGR